MKRYKYFTAVLAVCMLLTACKSNADAGNTKDQKNNPDAESGSANTDTTIDVSNLFSDRDMDGTYDASECEKITLSDDGCVSDSKQVSINKNTVTITGEGNYLLSGSLDDGMILVDVEKTQKVQLVLDGVNIKSNASAAIYVKEADKVFVTLANGSKNTLANGGQFTAMDENNIDAVIFSKDDLTMNGTGQLTITSPAGHGIVSKDELVITNGSYEITAASHGISGKDSVAVADGNFHITAGKDGIKSKNEDDTTAGFVYIGNGNYILNVESDGITAMNEVNIADGTIVIEKSKEGVEARIIKISGGEIDITASDDGVNATDKRSGSSDQNSGSRGDFKGGGMNDSQSDANVSISGGILKVNAEGDGLDSNGYLTVSGGEVYVAGPSNSGNAALDYGIDASISGGIVVAAGQSGMAQNFGSGSTQGSILVNTSQQNEANSDIVLCDSNGKELVAWTMEKSYNSVVVSCPEITDGGSYVLKTGNTDTEVTMDGLIYGDSFGFGGRKDGFERKDGEMHRRDDGMERPDGEMRRPDGEMNQGGANEAITGGG